MGNLIRLFEPEIVNASVATTVDRAFLFAPNHDPAEPLLARGCPPEALDPASPIIPVPSVINIIGAAAARAQELAPVNVHALEGSINHLHEETSARDGNIEALADFSRNFHAKLARDLNRLLERKGPVFAGPARITPCIDDESAFQQLIYSLTNPVKDGLIEHVRNSPFFSTYDQQAQGRTLLFWDIEWARWWPAGGPDNPKISPKQFLVWRKLEITPLPHLARLPAHQRQTLIRKSVAAVEADTAEKLRIEGRSVCPVAQLFATNPRLRPAKPRRSGPKPLVHASSRAARNAYRAKLRGVMRCYVPASVAFRAGRFDVEFPPGTFRPPLTKPKIGRAHV